MKGPAASHPAQIAVLPRAELRNPAPTLPRPRGGTLRSALQSVGFAALFVSGLYLWLAGQQFLVLWLHLLAGLALTIWLAPWLWRHVPTGLGQSQRSIFTNMSWLLLASWLVLLGSGLVMALPALLWLAGLVWFPQRPVTEALSWLHFWSAWLASGGLLLHLSLRHWNRIRS